MVWSMREHMKWYTSPCTLKVGVNPDSTTSLLAPNRVIFNAELYSRVLSRKCLELKTLPSNKTLRCCRGSWSIGRAIGAAHPSRKFSRTAVGTWNGYIFNQYYRNVLIVLWRLIVESSIGLRKVWVWWVSKRKCISSLNSEKPHRTMLWRFPFYFHFC